MTLAGMLIVRRRVSADVFLARKWIFIGALVALVASSASASPSFDCTKAKRPDEVAICANPYLAQTDLETTTAYESFKARNRKKAISIAKAFLARRHACGADEACIALSQQWALIQFEASPANKIEPVVSGTTANPPKPDPAMAVTNPWPAAFARRDFRLGMSLREFRSAPYPDPDKNPNAYLVCSNDPRAEQLGYSSARLYPDKLAAAGVVFCSYFYDVQMSYGSPMVMEAGIVLGDVSVMTGFYFIPDDAGVQRLFWISTEGPSDSFASLQQLMRKAYGEPTQRVETWQNKLGNKFENDVLTWSNSSSQIEFRHYGSTINKFELRHTLTPLWDKLSKSLDVQNSDAAKKL
ncbi:lysozyme inhibitor LprI family protein [Mesorhizobium sp. NPDC059054]|uniref:lysozyme inhibitor LprI family protein n=1 Tax=unclassified Mesorhizobium TaxID=325217 RepID=UPI0036ABD379